MKERKMKISWFSILEWEKEAEWLHKQQLDGWKFMGCKAPCFYYFEKCEPEDVVYQLDFNQEGLQHKVEYVQLFQDCGWEYITDMVGYSYFRKPAALMEGEEEIFCDDDSRMDMIYRVFKGKILPLVILFFCCILPNIFLQSIMNTSFLANLLMNILFVLALVYLILFVQFGIQYWKLCKRMNR